MQQREEPRSVYVQITLDANSINARQADTDLNQLERWQEDGVISFSMPRTAYNEARAGGNPRRAAKVAGRVFAETLANTPRERQQLRQIETTLFPAGAKSQGERNDVDIVFNALKYGAILVTNDGGSRRQPRGILGNREPLKRLGVRVMRPSEAVALVLARYTVPAEATTSTTGVLLGNSSSVIGRTGSYQTLPAYAYVLARSFSSIRILSRYTGTTTPQETSRSGEQLWKDFESILKARGKAKK